MSAEPPSEDCHQRIEIALTHPREELIESFQMARADPLLVGLEIRPDREYPQVVGVQRGDCVQIALDRVGIPIIPAVPPVVRGRVVHTEAVAGQIEAGDSSSLEHVKCSCRPRRLRGGDTGRDQAAGKKLPSIHRPPLATVRRRCQRGRSLTRPSIGIRQTSGFNLRASANGIQSTITLRIPLESGRLCVHAFRPARVSRVISVTKRDG